MSVVLRILFRDKAQMWTVPSLCPALESQAQEEPRTILSQEL